jgi:hypothetical protein
LNVPTPVFKSIMSALSKRDETADVCKDGNGKPESDAELRDNENVPLKEDVQTYFKREVLPHVPDAWIDESKTKVGYEIPFTRHFYKYKVLRSLTQIEGESASALPRFDDYSVPPLRWPLEGPPATPRTRSIPDGRGPTEGRTIAPRLGGRPRRRPGLVTRSR